MVNIYVEDRPDIVFSLDEKKGFFQRLQGLLGTTTLAPNHGIILYNTHQVHTFGMKYPIDCISLNENNEIIGAVFNVQPNRIVTKFPGTKHIIELGHRTEHEILFTFNKIIQKVYD